MRPLVVAAGLVVSCGAFASGCSSSGDGAEDSVRLDDRATVSSAELRDMVVVEDDRIEVRTPRDDIHRQLFGLIGRTFVSGRSATNPGNPSGFLREVVRVERSGDLTTLYTERSSLEHVIESGKVHASQDYAEAGIATQSIHPLAGDGARGAASGEFEIPETVLFTTPDFAEIGTADGASASGSVKLKSGKFRFRPKIEMDAEYDRGLRYFKLSAAGDFAASMVVHADVTVTQKGSLTQRSAPLTKTVKLFESPAARSFFLVGAVPVEFATSLVVASTCTLGLSAGVDLTVGGTLSARMDAGIEWRPGKLSNVSKTPDFRFAPVFDMQRAGAASLECGVRLGVEILFYEVAGGELTVGPYVKAELATTGPRSGKLDLWTGAKAELEGKFEVLSYGLTLSPKNPLFEWPKNGAAGAPIRTWPVEL